MLRDTASPWPPKPYLGLNYFRAQDRPLLAGRDADIADCTELLTHPQTRVLLLHGATGCGKSSFLRAGLIPTFEDHGPSHLFLRAPDGDREALFIRCTAAPVDQIARQIFLFAERRFLLRTPRGERLIDLSPALLGCTRWEDYLRAARDHSEDEFGLARSLRIIVETIPQTLVLIIDQAEEVLTLNPGAEDYRNRALFFGFLREFQRLAFDARILVALRTEYLGRFLDGLQVSYRNESTFCYFLLSELTPDALREAILRPTLREEVPPWGVPYDTYRFCIEPDLAGKIVADVLQARYSGPALPVLQLVCLGLYEGLNGRDEITAADYDATGRTEGQVVAHIKHALRVRDADENRRADAKNPLQDFLAGFYLMQDDGTVVARTRSAAWAREQLEKHMSPDAAAELLARLTTPQTLVLRSLRNVTSDGHIADEITLGHDTIALAVERWRSLDAAERAAERAARRRRQENRELSLAYCIYFVVVALAIIGAFASLSIRERLWGVPTGAYDLVRKAGESSVVVLSLATKAIAVLIAFVWTFMWFFFLPLGVCVWISKVPFFIATAIRRWPTGEVLRRAACDWFRAPTRARAPSNPPTPCPPARNPPP